MKCIYFKHPQTYLLGEGLRKRSKYKRKFSPKKVAREQKLLDLFIESDNAKEAS